MQKQTVGANSSGNVACTVGTQGTHQLFILPKSSLTLMESTAAGAATVNPVRLFIYGVKFTYSVRNQSNANAKCTLYDIVTRKDPVTAAIDSPVEAWDKGMADFGMFTPSNVVGQTPFRSPEFRQYFRVQKVTSFNLEPGQQHEHVVHNKYNKMISSERFQNVPGTTAAGLTRFSLLVFHGSLAHETAPPNAVTTTAVGLDWYQRTEFTYGFIEKVQPTYAFTDALPKTVTNLDMMVEQDDQDGDPIIS